MSRRLSDAVQARADALPHAGHLDRDAPGFAVGAAEDEAHAARVRIHLRAATAERIDEAAFLAFGCPSVIACASWIAEHAVGTAVGTPAPQLARRAAAALTLDPDRTYAAELAVLALDAAARDWHVRHGGGANPGTASDRGAPHSPLDAGGSGE